MAWAWAWAYFLSQKINRAWSYIFLFNLHFRVICQKKNNNNKRSLILMVTTIIYFWFDDHSTSIPTCEV